MQIEEDLLALIAHGQPLARQLLGLPGGGELDADAAPEIARLLRRQHRIEPVEQMLRHPLLLAQQRAAGRLHGVSGEHRLDAQAAEQRQNLLEAPGHGPAGVAMRIFHARRLRAAAVLAEIVPAAADAVDFLREVHSLEPHGEGTDQVARERRRPVAHRDVELEGAPARRRCGGGWRPGGRAPPARRAAVRPARAESHRRARRARARPRAGPRASSGKWISLRFTAHGW